MIKLSDFLLLRCPVNSLNLYSQWPIKDAVILKDALELAAPEFLSELKKINYASEKDQIRLHDSLYKYWLRSCTRCTPYGLFAGSAAVDIINEKTSLIINSKRHYKQARLDMNYLFLVKERIEKLPGIQSQLRLSVNNSLYETALDYRYAESFMVGEKRNYKLSSAQKSPYISYVLENLENYKSLDDLILCFMSKFTSFDRKETLDFLMEMWSAQILVNDLELVLTGVDPLTHLIATLKQYTGIEEIIDNLEKVNCLLKKGGNVDYGDLIRNINSLLVIDEPIKDVIQADLFLSLEQRMINKSLIEETVGQAEDLFNLFRIVRNPRLERFINNFANLFEGREVELSIALDDDIGIGYSDDSGTSSIMPTMIKDLPIIENNTNLPSYNDYVTQFTFKKYQEFVTENKEFIEIYEEDLADFRPATQGRNFASSQFLFGSFLKMRDEGGMEGLLLDINMIGGPSAANLLGRFTLGNEELTELAKRVIDKEEAEYPDAIFAEIVHTPQARLGNVLLRSNLRKYEIPYLGKSGMKNHLQIPISDLVVSVRDGAVILRSIKHNKRVFPRLSTAHNFNTKFNLPIYRFLCDLQTQNQAIPNVWDWGILSSIKYLPRVVYKNLILQRARWVIEEKDVFDIAKNNNFNKFLVFLKDKNLPSSFLMVQGDNHLLIDTREEKALRILLTTVKKYKSVILQEFLFNDDNCIVRDVHGNPYTNEVIIPFFRKNEVKEESKISPRIASGSVQKKFAPGSEWFYVKLYGGEKSLDKIITGELAEFLSLNEKHFTKCFYVRYRDEQGSHLRLRFLELKRRQQDDLLKLFQDFFKRGQVKNIVIDSYDREIERYSEELIEEVETLFYYDSFSTLRLNQLLLQVEEPHRYRLLLGLRGVEMFLNDFGFDLMEKLDLLKKMSLSYFVEFGSSSSLRAILNTKFRENQKDIFVHMNKSHDEINEITEAVELFMTRSRLTKQTIFKINTFFNSEEQERKSKLVIDCIHMSMNRLFSNNQRRYELVVYTFLERYYSSKKAIDSKSSL